MINKFKIFLSLEFVYIIGLFIFGVMIYGLIINFVLPKIGFTQPLSFIYIWPVYLIFLFPIIKLVSNINNWIRESINLWPIKLMILINPLLAILGVNRLDNTGDGRLAIISVILVCLVFIFTFLRKDNNEGTLKLAIYSSALSLILANSLRSNFLVGWDIHQEFFVFRLTNIANFWNINTFKDAYNACLSITILPTIIHNLTGISQLTIFRFIYPLIIALIPVIVFLIGTRFTSKKIAYAGAFAFLIQAQFISQLPALLRQGIAFIFFALMIDSLIRNDFTQKYRNLIVLIFGSGMILSHYSTTYIALTLLLVAKSISVLLSKVWLDGKKSTSLSYGIIAILFLSAFLWNVLITNTTDGLFQTFSKVTDNISETFSLEGKSDMVKSIFYQTSDNSTAVINYSKESLKDISNPEEYKGYEIHPVSRNIGKPMKITDPIPIYFHIFIPWIFRIGILIGFIFLVLKEIKKHQNPLVISIGFSMFVVIISIILLPFLSVNYNFERLYQQMLILLAPISIFGFLRLFSLLKKLTYTIPISIILLSFIFQSTGLIDHLVYKTSPWMFGNSSEQYYRYFSTKSEIGGISWLENNVKANSLLYADRYTKLRIGAYLNQKFGYISSEINPPVIEKYGYVFSGLAGSDSNNSVYTEVKNQQLIFSFPHKYLEENRNKIYSNSITKIYK